MRTLRQLLITVGCLALYFAAAAIAVGLILFLGCGIFAVWSFFWNVFI